MKSSGIGGQAVLEGVMMKNQNQYAVAVRTPDQRIEVKLDTYTSFSEKVKLFKLPVLRGVLAFIESLVLGMKTLTYSAGFYEEEEEKAKTPEEKAKQEKKENVMMSATVAFSVVLAIGVFIVLPFFISGLFGKLIPSQILLRIVEGVIRIVLFMGYILLISQMKDIRRVFMYHGAEHKTINCIESGRELTVANVKRSSKEHRRCGTSFMLVVMLVSAVLFVFINTEILWLRILLRILLIPVIAGVSYEFIRLAGRSDSKIVAVLSKPGLWMQGLTTREPDEAMIEVAIASVEAVFDWRQYLADNGVKKYAKNSGKADKAGSKGRQGKNSKGGTGAAKDTKDAQAGKTVAAREASAQSKAAKENAAVQEAAAAQAKAAVKEAAVSEQERQENAARERREQQKTKVKLQPTSILDEDEEEDDDILRALDRYFDDDKED